MSLLKKEAGVVLKRARSGSASSIVTMLGAESGKIKLMAKGARTKDSPFRGSLEPGSIIEAVYYFKERREIYFLRETAILTGPPPGAASLQALSARLAALELVDQICYPGDPDRAVWELIVSYLRTGRAADPLVLFLAFEVKLLGALGVLPEFHLCAECGAPVARGRYDPANGMSFCERERTAGGELMPLDGALLDVLDRAGHAGLQELAGLELSDSVRKRFGLLLHWTYTYHVQGYRVPNSLKLLK